MSKTSEIIMNGVNKGSAVALFEPKFAHNVGAALRSCSCWNIPHLIWSGKAVPHPDEWATHKQLKEFRLPREERMKGYKNVAMTKSERFKDHIKGRIPIAVEILPESQNLFDFQHPENAMYIFGPENGGLNRNILQHCHSFVTIPTSHCLNLAAAVNVVLSHRTMQMYTSGLISIDYASMLIAEIEGRQRTY